MRRRPVSRGGRRNRTRRQGRLIRPASRSRKNSKMISGEDALALLRSAGTPENVIHHCEVVCRKALSIARLIGEGDQKLIEAGALLHDIGRSKTHGVSHGVVGAQIIRQHRLPEKLAKIVERHLGAGLTKKEAAALGLPPRDYLPRTPEERIVCYADKLVSDSRTHRYEETRAAYVEFFGEGSAPVRRLDRLHTEMAALIKKRPP